jgi:hypothetical protein
MPKLERTYRFTSHVLKDRDIRFYLGSRKISRGVRAVVWLILGTDFGCKRARPKGNVVRLSLPVNNSVELSIENVEIREPCDSIGH